MDFMLLRILLLRCFIFTHPFLVSNSPLSHGCRRSSVFRTISLYHASYNISFNLRVSTEEKVSVASKIFAALLPIILIVTVNSKAVFSVPILWLILDYMISMLTQSLKHIAPLTWIRRSRHESYSRICSSNPRSGEVYQNSKINHETHETTFWMVATRLWILAARKQQPWIWAWFWNE